MLCINITHSWIELASKIGMDFICCSPEGFEPSLEAVNMLKQSSISSYQLSHDPLTAVKGADIIYTDVWASMGQKEEAEKREKIFSPYQVNMKLLELTGKSTLFMHCLPADKGQEVSRNIFEDKRCVVLKEAENRMHLQKSILRWCLSLF